MNFLYPLFIAIILLSSTSFGQGKKISLGLEVIKQTLPQVLDQNPNSVACYLKGGAMYELLLKASNLPVGMDSVFNVADYQYELDSVAESVNKLLEKHKITVVLSDTLFAYSYKPRYSVDNDGWVDTTDLRNSETWKYEREDLIDVFQTRYEFRGMKQEVDLAFIDLIQKQIYFKGDDYTFNLSDLDNERYIFTNSKPADSDTLHKQGLLINAVRVYQPVFNGSKTKACYLFAWQTRNGPWREFVFVEKKKGKWYFVESWGSEHVDLDEHWMD